MRYGILAAACRDIEQVQVAPDFAGVEIGLAERPAARAGAQSGGVPAEQPLAAARKTGGLGLAAVQRIDVRAGNSDEILDRYPTAHADVAVGAPTGAA